MKTIKRPVSKNKDFLIVNFIGPSGSGKTTIGEHFKSEGIDEVVSHTTRPMRVGEVHGVSYYFVSEEEFKDIEKVEFSDYSNGKYCLSKKELEEKLAINNVVFAITDIKGNEQVKEKYPDNVISIFIEVTYDEMIKRMKFRGDSKENIAKRITNAILNDELYNGSKCDYIIRNEIFNQAIFQIKEILKLEGVEFFD